MNTSQLNFYNVMYAIDTSKTPFDKICEEYNFPPPHSDEFSLVLQTYNMLIKRSVEGRLVKHEPALFTENFTVTDYIKQKVWWHSGPDNYYSLAAEVTYLTVLLASMQKEKETMKAAHEQEIEKINSSFTEIITNFNKKITDLESSAPSFFTSILLSTVLAAVSYSIFRFRQ